MVSGWEGEWVMEFPVLPPVKGQRNFKTRCA